MKTHYYGGIKKYQWAALPLSLHGVVVKKAASASRSSSAKTKPIPSCTSAICRATFPPNR